jgi:hypothetical protein
MIDTRWAEFSIPGIEHRIEPYRQALDIRLRWCSNRSFRTYRLLQVMATNQLSQTLLNRFPKVVVQSRLLQPQK